MTWGTETAVDFDLGLNRCVRQVRSALLDNADTPRYIETIPRVGYRFIAAVKPLPGKTDEPHALPAIESSFGLDGLSAPVVVLGINEGVTPKAKSPPKDGRFSAGSPLWC